MNHPELIAVPVLMLADYVLTVLGAASSAAVYRQHFAMSSYELNPLWRGSVDRIQWFNPRHTALVVLVAVLLVLLDQVPQLDESFELILGMLLGVYGAVCGRHLTNLMLFRYVNRHPGEVSGRVEMSMKLMLKMSQQTYMGLIPLFAIIVALVPNRYTVGVLLGLVLLVLMHFAWLRSARSGTGMPPQQPVEAELVDTDG